jgi:hypothetical protein
MLNILSLFSELYILWELYVEVLLGGLDGFDLGKIHFWSEDVEESVDMLHVVWITDSS